jgi:hypothetical protein
MDSREIEMQKNWGPVASNSDESLKKVAMDLYNGLIFTDRHCGSDVMSSFMVLMFMGPQPPKSPQHPNDTTSIENDRDNDIYDILQRDADQAKYEEDMKWYDKEYEYYRENKLKSIGLIYEYLSEAGPMSVNGKPIFFSARLMNHEDAAKMFEYYEKYKSIRETADNF